MSAAEATPGPWWDAYRDVIRPEYTDLIGYEAKATRIRQSEALCIPGLLQTEAYAKAWICAQLPGRRQHTDTLVAVRMRRQSILNGPLAAEFVVDESAFHRQVGGAHTLAEQIAHLKAVAARPNITIRVIPHSAGVYPGIGEASFSLLTLPDESLVAHWETTTDSWTGRGQEQIGAFEERWQQLAGIAVDLEQL